MRRRWPPAKLVEQELSDLPRVQREGSARPREPLSTLRRSGLADLSSSRAPDQRHSDYDKNHHRNEVADGSNDHDRFADRNEAGKERIEPDRERDEADLSNPEMGAREGRCRALGEQVIEEGEDGEAESADIQKMGVRGTLVVCPDRIDQQAEQQPDDCIDQSRPEEPCGKAFHRNLRIG